jgi:hypothetical protein
MNIDLDDLPCTTSKESRVRELLQHLRRRGRIDELVRLCAQERPRASWTDDAEPAKAQRPTPGAGRTPDGPAPLSAPSLSIESSRLNAAFELKCDRSAYLQFMQAAFAVEEILQFIQDNDDFRQLAYSLPANPSHSDLARQLFEYAHRRNRLGALFEALAQHNPAQYREHGPMIESAQLRINVVFDVQGDDARLRALQARPLDKEAEQRLEQAAREAFLGHSH